MMACHILLVAQFCAIVKALKAIAAIAIAIMTTALKIMTAKSGYLA